MHQLLVEVVDIGQANLGLADNTLSSLSRMIESDNPAIASPQLSCRPLRNLTVNSIPSFRSLLCARHPNNQSNPQIPPRDNPRSPPHPHIATQPPSRGKGGPISRKCPSPSDSGPRAREGSEPRNRGFAQFFCPAVVRAAADPAGAATDIHYGINSPD